MIRKWAFIVLLAVTLNILMAGQTSTSSYSDGNFWRSINNLSSPRDTILIKTAFIRGLLEGSQSQILIIKADMPGDIAKIFIEEMEKNPLFIGRFTGAVEQVVNGVEDVYKDYANLNIPVFGIVGVVIKRITGTISDQEATEILQNLRARWNVLKKK